MLTKLIKMKKLIFLVPLLIFLSGCASTPYVRSDIFVDSQALNSVYIMPIVMEVTLDPDFEITREKLQFRLKEIRKKVRNTLQEEFFRRGYTIAGYSKQFHELDPDDQNDQMIKLAIKEFLHPTDREYEGFNDEFSEALRSLFGNIEVKDSEGNIVTLRELESKEKSKKEKKPNSLVIKTLEARGAFPEGIDTVMYLEIKSFIARRGLWNSLQETSTVKIRMRLVGLREEKIVFSYNVSQDKSDILDWKSFKKVFLDVLAKVPVKLIQ